MSALSSPVYDRVSERRRAVALARHFRDAEGLSIAQIAERLGRSPATVKAYFCDPTGEKARAVKARYVGLCRGCGAYTQPRNGKGDAYRYCKACHPGAIKPRWTPELVLEAMREWRQRYAQLPSSYDWSDLHELRHACATLLLERGLSSADVALQLGHTDGGRLVQTLYGHRDERLARDRVKMSFAADHGHKRGRPVRDVGRNPATSA
jgi:AraC-like DNA-binding protein